MILIVYELAVSVSPGNLLEMQFLKATLKLSESKICNPGDADAC